MHQTGTIALTSIKSRMRGEAKERRAALSAAFRQTASQHLAGHGLDFLHLSAQPFSLIVGGFMPIGEEISPLPLMARLVQQGYRLALPVMMGKAVPLEFRAYTPGDALAAGVWNIREPGSDKPALLPDIVLTALLAFDNDGYRLGYGGGYYDRTLRALRVIKPVIAVGLGFDEQRVDAVPHLDYDEPVDWILTPSGAVRSRRLGPAA